MQYCEGKFLFVHVPKTGGQSVTDIIAPHSNYMFDQHDTLFRASRLFEEVNFRKLYKFGFVRNPFDREVSNYFWHTKQNDKYQASFEDWTKWRYSEDSNLLCAGDFRDNDTYWYQKGFGKNPQVGFFIKPNGTFFPNLFIGRYETLIEDWETIAEKINVSKMLPHSQKSSNDGDYRKHYTDELVDIVTKAHKIDLDVFNYDFEKGMISKDINMDIPINVHLHYNYNYYYG